MRRRNSGYNLIVWGLCLAVGYIAVNGLLGQRSSRDFEQSWNETTISVESQQEHQASSEERPPIVPTTKITIINPTWVPTPTSTPTPLPTETHLPTDNQRSDRSRSGQPSGQETPPPPVLLPAGDQRPSGGG